MCEPVRLPDSEWEERRIDSVALAPMQGHPLIRARKAGLMSLRGFRLSVSIAGGKRSECRKRAANGPLHTLAFLTAVRICPWLFSQSQSGEKIDERGTNNTHTHTRAKTKVIAIRGIFLPSSAEANCYRGTIQWPPSNAACHELRGRYMHCTRFTRRGAREVGNSTTKKRKIRARARDGRCASDHEVKASVE